MTENIDKSLGEIIKTVLEERDINYAAVARKMNVTRTVISTINKRKNIDVKFLTELENATGIDFHKYLPESLSLKTVAHDEVSLVQEPSVGYDRYNNHNGIPYYNTDVTVFNVKAESPTYYMTLPGFDDCDFAINVSGHAMDPDYCSGDVVLCKQLKNLNVIPLGEAYLIITDEHKLLRKIKKGVNETNYTLAAGNTEYEDWLIEKKEIQTLYLIKGKLERNQI